MKKLSDYTKKKEQQPIDVSLGKCFGDGGYCCTNVSAADLFLRIMPQLNSLFKSELLQLKDNPKFSNELSPAAVNYYGSDNKIIATYKREVMRKIPTRLTPFAKSATYVPTVTHNVISFGDSCDRDKFIEKCKELSNGVIDFDKYIAQSIQNKEQ